jgi:hypothetical protein
MKALTIEYNRWKPSEDFLFSSSVAFRLVSLYHLRSFARKELIGKIKSDRAL